MPEKLSLADQAGLIAKNEVKLRTEYDGTQGKVSVTADHKFKYNITLRAYFEAILWDETAADGRGANFLEAVTSSVDATSPTSRLCQARRTECVITTVVRTDPALSVCGGAYDVGSGMTIAQNPKLIQTLSSAKP